jgi:serine phosphatase RsbU (regulator of sigma subunit)
LEPQQLLGRRIQDLDIHQEIIGSWMGIIREATQKRSIVKSEIPFPSSIGDRIMQVNAIPEQNESQAVESFLVVSHDITEQKEAEIELLNINRKITESINYAKRIQSAILPDSFTIQKQLPDSFIYYKPRDVVSGDFPWFMQKGDDIFIAAVDCTGHGVPGALISLIGYFILNDIVNTQAVSNPGEILDMLNEGVTRTLRQDITSATRDGMDISLCKINLAKKEVHYSGAHRPLYYIKDGEFGQIKGDRFPIGGGQHKNRDNFVSTTLKVSSGDTIYMFSDGLTDQFGGVDNKKFSPRKVREIITTHHGKSMASIRQIFDDEFEIWKGNRKQTDDVLAIGIKF